ncbi:glycerophosphodiester phosphodiesterase [Salinicoccus jeotgali]|uniref:Glycerophosphodiester phosphodiesterase n=1 Tax=Salinicoccus jeotgali TaxID=381634 RepID=A0ABP7F783_9STAP
MWTKVFAHRGAMGDYPENTLLAFKKALDASIDGLEIDVHLSRDGEVVVIHDEDIKRTTDGHGAVRDMTLETLREVSAGVTFSDYKYYDPEVWKKEKIPTLNEVLALAEGYNVELNIELKTDVIQYEGIERRVFDIVGAYGCHEKVIYSSFNLSSLARMKMAHPEARLAWLTKEVPERAEHYMGKHSLEALHISWKAILEQPERISGIGERIRAWTVNDWETAADLIGHGVGTLVTDYPKEMKEILRNVEK